MKKFIHFICLILIFNFVFVPKTQSQVYDIVIQGGRVIDPETHFDAIRNIGVLNGKIAIITSKALQGKQIVSANHLVVSPGFIDLHIHGRTNKEQSFQLHDGLTTALELEWGVVHIKDWLRERNGKALINYGASVCWPYERFKTFTKYQQKATAFELKALKGETQLDDIFNTIDVSYVDSLSEKQLETVETNMLQSLHEGAIGIGAPIGYLFFSCKRA